MGVKNIAAGSLVLILMGGLLAACSRDKEQDTVIEPAPPQVTVPASSGTDLIASGQLEEAQSSGLTVEELEADKADPKRWQERLDNGDDPLTPGCACQHE